MKDSFFSLLNWLRDPFGVKDLKARHAVVRRELLETATRAEDTALIIRHYPVGHMLVRKNRPKRNPRTKEKM